MTTFGFSAYLKLLSSSPRRQRSIIKSRIAPSGGSYDFHRSFRRAAARYLLNEEPYEDIERTLTAITRTPERNSATIALGHLRDWRRTNPGTCFAFDTVVYESPRGVFNIKFSSDFGMLLTGRRTAVHLWNTANPSLTARAVFSSLQLFPSIFGHRPNAPEDLAVLSMRDRRIYRLSESPDFSLLSRRTVEAVESIFFDVYSEVGDASITDHEPPRPTPS